MTFHQLQVRAYEREIRQRLAELESVPASRRARRLWLIAVIKRSRDRATWHEAFGSRRESSAVEALGAEALFYQRRGGSNRDRRERERSLARAQNALHRAGALLARENGSARGSKAAGAGDEYRHQTEVRSTQ